MTKHSEPEFTISLLLRAASLAGVDPAAIPGDKNPWQWKDPRAASLRSAIRHLDAQLADAAEAQWGDSMSLALRGALAGETKWTPQLERELEVRRPALAKERREKAVNEALNRMAENTKAEQQARQARTPSPEQLRAQLIASKNATFTAAPTA